MTIETHTRLGYFSVFLIVVRDVSDVSRAANKIGGFQHKTKSFLLLIIIIISRGGVRCKKVQRKCV